MAGRYSAEAQKRNEAYMNNYNKENYDRITIMRSKGDKEKLDQLAKARGVSRNELLNWCIDQQLKSLGFDI